MKNLIDKILSKLIDEKKEIKLKVQRQERDFVTISFCISREQRLDLIKSIEEKAEVSNDVLRCFAIALKNKQLNDESWIEEENEYWDRIYNLQIKENL